MEVFDGAQDALNRVRRAYRRGTGAHLTAAMIQSLGVTAFGQMWAEDDPRLPAENSAADVQGSGANTSQDGLPEDEPLLTPPPRAEGGE